jgi:zona occludens toxin (predicted ATPase)
MAYITKLPSGLWRAQIARKGVRRSQSFTTKAAATAWATREESAIIDGTASLWPRKTLADALDRYEKDITPGKG